MTGFPPEGLRGWGPRKGRARLQPDCFYLPVYISASLYFPKLSKVETLWIVLKFRSRKFSFCPSVYPEIGRKENLRVESALQVRHTSWFHGMKFERLRLFKTHRLVRTIRVNCTREKVVSNKLC